MLAVAVETTHPLSHKCNFVQSSVCLVSLLKKVQPKKKFLIILTY